MFNNLLINRLFQYDSTIRYQNSFNPRTTFNNSACKIQVKSELNLHQEIKFYFIIFISLNIYEQFMYEYKSVHVIVDQWKCIWAQ